MYNYDLVISLGGRCRTASALKLLKITEKTYPFDWTDYEDLPSKHLLTKCNLIANHFENAFNFEDFVELPSHIRKHKIIKNTTTGLQYIHDFPWETSVKDFFPTFLEKHLRRVKRLYDDIEKANSVLFVFEDVHRKIPLNTIKTAISILKKSFPNKNVNMLVLLPVLPDGYRQYKEIKLNIKDVTAVLCSRLYIEGIPYNKIVSRMSKYLGQFFGMNYFSFAEDVNIECYGLSEIENWGRWSDGDSIFFRLQTTKQTENVSVDINVKPFVCENKPQQKCKIFCNGYEIKEMVIVESQTISLTVPNDNSGNLDFVFEFDNTLSPKELGLSEDNRKLGLGFIDAIISENV